MSSAVVAWLALAVAVGLGVVLVVLYRRLTALSREHTERKWELVVLRAEIGDLRRRVRPADEGNAGVARVPERAGGDPTPAAARPVRRRTASPTAWRRAAGAPVRPRRRRPG